MSAWTDLRDELQAIGMWDVIAESEASTEEGAAMLVLAVFENLSDEEKANLVSLAQAWVDSTPSQNPRVAAVRAWLDDYADGPVYHSHELALDARFRIPESMLVDAMITRTPFEPDHGSFTLDAMTAFPKGFRVESHVRSPLG